LVAAAGEKFAGSPIIALDGTAIGVVSNAISHLCSSANDPTLPVWRPVDRPRHAQRSASGAACDRWPGRAWRARVHAGLPSVFNMALPRNVATAGRALDDDVLPF